MLTNVFNYAKDVYLNNNPETDADEIVRYVGALESPKEFKRALITGDVCPAIYLDVSQLDELHRTKTEYSVQILDDEGNVWDELTEDQLGSW